MNAQTFVLLDKFKGHITEYIQSTKTSGSNVDVAIDVFVTTKLPEIISLAQTVLADGRLDFFEVVRVISFASKLVKDSLPIYSKSNITEKLGVVREIIQFIVKELVPNTNDTVDFILEDKNIDGLINIIYKLLVKFRK